MKIGLVGTRHIHIGDFIDVLASGQLRGYVHDADRDRGDEVAQCLGWPHIHNLDALASFACVDAFIVASTTAEHDRIVPALARAGKPVFIEKPLAASCRKSESLAAMLGGVPFHTGYFLKDIPVLQCLAGRIAAGSLGDILSIHMSYSHNGLEKGWFNNYGWMLEKDAAGYGGFGDMGLHCVNMLRYLSMASPQSFEACTGRIENAPPETPDHFGTGRLVAPHGPDLTFYAGWKEDPDFKGARPLSGSLFSVEAQGTKGCAFLHNGGGFIETVEGRENFPPLHFSSGDGIRTFLNAVQLNRPELFTPLDETLEDIRQMEALYQAAGPRAQRNAAPRPAPVSPG